MSATGTKGPPPGPYDIAKYAPSDIKVTIKAGPH